MKIYLSPPELTGREIALIGEAVASGWIAPLGPQVDAFEAEIAACVGMPQAVALSSGTAALHLALLVLGVEAGDEVWTSTLTFAATANAISYVGATPVFFDSDATTWNLDAGLLVEQLELAARGNRLPKAVIAVDLYGQCFDADAIAVACRKHGVALIEDAAEALGATSQGRPAGALADLSVLSFNGNKIITTSGGGMLLTREAHHAARARHLATQARQPARHYEHHEVGFNYRLSNLLAAVGRAQLPDLERRVQRRREINQRYRLGLKPLGNWMFQSELHGTRSTYWLTCATVGSGALRDRYLEKLAEQHIEARPVWKPLHTQRAFHGARIVRGSVSERLFEEGICLPSGSALRNEDVDAVIHVLTG